MNFSAYHCYSRDFKIFPSKITIFGSEWRVLKDEHEGGYRYSASGLGVRWVVAIDPTRVRVPARALFLLQNVLLSRLPLFLNCDLICFDLSQLEKQ